MSAPFGAVPATACQVARMIADAAGTRFRVVGSLPGEGEPNIVYLVPRAEPGSGNAYDEYVFASDAWERVGSTDIDLSGYVEKEEGKGLFSGSYDDLTDKPAIPSAVTVDGALSGTSENPVQNKAVKAALDGKLSRAEAAAGFTEWVVERNGVDVTSQIAMPPHYEGINTWIVEDSLVAGDELPASPGLSALPDAVELSWESGDGVHAYTAARAKLRPMKTSDLQNDSGFLTQHQDISGKADKSEMSVMPGTGADADKATIQLKSGVEAIVLVRHQELRYAVVAPVPSVSATDVADDTVAVQLHDRAMNQVTLGAGIAYATLTFPAKEAGKARDFFVRLAVTGSDVPTLYFKEQDGAPVAFDVDDDSWAEIEQGVNVLMFSDTSEAGA